MLLESVNQRALMAHVYAEVKGLGRMLSRMVTERGFKLQARTKLAVSALELPETSQEWRFGAGGVVTLPQSETFGPTVFLRLLRFSRALRLLLSPVAHTPRPVPFLYLTLVGFLPPTCYGRFTERCPPATLLNTSWLRQRYYRLFLIKIPTTHFPTGTSFT